MADLELPNFFEFKQFKSYFATEFIMRGCTTLITSFSIEYLSQFHSSLNSKRKELLNCPIDYCLVLKCKAGLVSPELLRLMKRNRIPAVFVEFSEIGELEKKAWGWIKQALYGYPLVFCPYIPLELDKREKTKLLKGWHEILQTEGIPHVHHPITPKNPLPLQILKLIGIYPLKGNFRAGGEISYNLYKSPASEIVDESQSILYDNHMLILTVHKGKVLMSNGRCFFQPGIGEELVIKTPGFLT
ncbi:hypothetical protein [Bacillus salacetis]|nr:hypothetical protein [Bacillus salacetis]